MDLFGERKCAGFLFLVFFVLWSSSAEGDNPEGPFYNEIRAMGMGNTAIATTTDRTAIFHNPAGLSLLGNNVEFSINPVSVSIDGSLPRVISNISSQGDKIKDVSKIDQDFMDMLNELDGNWVGFSWLPEITFATQNIGFGMYSVMPLDVRLESGHFIPKLGLKGERDLVFTWAVGIPLKHEPSHLGISVEYLQRTPLEETITKYSDTYLTFQDLQSSPLGIVGNHSDIKHGASFDVGMIHNLKGFRIGYGVKDIFGVIGGELTRPRLDVGVAYYFPQVEEVEWIDGLIVSAELSDLFGTEEETGELEQFAKKVHAGFEWDLKYAALRAGINKGYPTLGAGLKFGIFKLDYVWFTEELGYYAGQYPVKKHLLSMGIDFTSERSVPDYDKDRNETPDMVTKDSPDNESEKGGAKDETSAKDESRDESGDESGEKSGEKESVSERNGSEGESPSEEDSMSDETESDETEENLDW